MFSPLVRELLDKLFLELLLLFLHFLTLLFSLFPLLWSFLSIALIWNHLHLGDAVGHSLHLSLEILLISFLDLFLFLGGLCNLVKIRRDDRRPLVVFGNSFLLT